MPTLSMLETSKSVLREKLDAAREINITVTGRKSGRKISLPVWFVQQKDKVVLMPVRGITTNWFRNVKKSPVMEVSVKGITASGNCMTITDPKRVNEVAEMFRVKYGAGDVQRYYPRIDACVELNSL